MTTAADPTGEIAARFDSNGFVVAPDLFRRHETARIKQEIQSIVAQARADAQARGEQRPRFLQTGVLMKEAAETMLPFYQGVWWPEVSDGAGKHITAAMRNEVPVKQALDQGQADAKAAIEAKGGKVE